MSYTPTEWKTGDIVTSTKLNKLEQGVANAGGGPLVVNITYDDGTNTYTCDKTAAEIWDASPSVVLYEASSETGGQYSYPTFIAGGDDGLSFEVGELFFSAESMSDYPSTGGN